MSSFRRACAHVLFVVAMLSASGIVGTVPPQFCPLAPQSPLGSPGPLPFPLPVPLPSPPLPVLVPVPADPTGDRLPLTVAPP